MASYGYLANLEKVGVEFIDGYGAAQYNYVEDLAFVHGTFAESKGSTAAKLSKANPDINIVQGHKHNIETHTHTDRRGRQLVAAVFRALCSTQGLVPGVHSAVGSNGRPAFNQENWAQGVMHIEDYGNGHYVFNQIPIIRGVAHYRGKAFVAQGEAVEESIKLQEAALGPGQPLTDVYGVYTKPHQPIRAIVSVDQCEVTRRTAETLHEFTGVLIKSTTAYSKDTWYDADRTSKDFERSVFTNVLRVIMSSGSVQPVRGIDDIGRYLSFWRQNGVFIVANTSNPTRLRARDNQTHLR